MRRDDRPGRMAKVPTTGHLTLASVVRCAGCFTGPDEVHLAATLQGLEPAALSFAPGAGGGAIRQWIVQRSLTGGSHSDRMDGNPSRGLTCKLATLATMTALVAVTAALYAGLWRLAWLLWVHLSRSLGWA